LAYLHEPTAPFIAL